MRHQQLMTRNSQLRPIIKTPSQECLGFYKVFQTWPLISIDFLNSCTKMDPQDRLTADELIKHTYFTHDKFPQRYLQFFGKTKKIRFAIFRFLPALREKVNMEFNAPLLRKLKSDVIASTDRRDENHKPRKLSNDGRWRFTLNEGLIQEYLNIKQIFMQDFCRDNEEKTQ